MQPLPPIPPVRTIDEVLDAIETSIEWSLLNESRLGYFAALYKRITRSIRKNLPNFQDPPRMERLDVGFASRYFDALNGWFHPSQSPPLPHGWRVAFQAAPLARPIIVQHLLAGITPHIGLDLGIAAATVIPGKELPSLKPDFNLVNQLLANEVKGVLDELDSLSPVMAEVYDVFAKRETEAIDVMLDFTRADAWAFATQLALLDAEGQQAAIAERDVLIANAAAKVVSPPSLIAKMFEAVWLLESHNVTKIIETLNAQAEAVR